MLFITLVETGPGNLVTFPGPSSPGLLHLKQQKFAESFNNLYCLKLLKVNHYFAVLYAEILL